MDLRNLPPLDVMSFFKLHCKLGKAKRRIPLVDAFLSEEAFGSIEICCSHSEINLFVKVNHPFTKAQFPEVYKGDGVEVWIDTRGGYGVETFHKYAHHFIFLPAPVDGIEAAEISRFRTLDRHDLASPEDFIVKTALGKKGYEMEITIPESALFGYNPEEVKKLGFAYRIHRAKGEPMHFPVSGMDYKVESYPALWAAVDLEESL